MGLVFTNRAVGRTGIAGHCTELSGFRAPARPPPRSHPTPTSTLCLIAPTPEPRKQDAKKGPQPPGSADGDPADPWPGPNPSDSECRSLSNASCPSTGALLCRTAESRSLRSVWGGSEAEARRSSAFSSGLILTTQTLFRTGSGPLPITLALIYLSCKRNQN